MAYHPEPYWSRVATDIRKRGPHNYVAGDDDPFYRYKRQKFLARFLGTIDFDSKVVLEVGSGPGGNLLQIARAGARRVIGIDISRQMLDLAAETLKGYEMIVELHKTDGEHLPLADRAVNLAFTVTVLQHNTNTSMFQSLLGEICRVTRTWSFSSRIPERAVLAQTPIAATSRAQWKSTKRSVASTGFGLPIANTWA